MSPENGLLRQANETKGRIRANGIAQHDSLAAPVSSISGFYAGSEIDGVRGRALDEKEIIGLRVGGGLSRSVDDERIGAKRGPRCGQKISDAPCGPGRGEFCQI